MLPITVVLPPPPLTQRHTTSVVPIRQPRPAIDVDSYGVRRDRSYFFIQFNIGGDRPPARLSYSVGSGSASAPTGSAAWTGAMIGVDVSGGADRDAIVPGRADIRFALESMTVT